MQWNPQFIVGIMFALSSLLLSTVALLIQKYAAEFEADRPFYKRPRLIAGLSLNLFSEVALSPFAIMYAPLSLISPLGGVGMIFNGVLTHFGCICGIREQMKCRGWVSTLFIVAGVGLVAIASNNTGSAQWTATDLEERVRRPKSLIALASCVIITLLLSCATRCIKGWSNASARAGAAGIMGTLSVFCVKIIINICTHNPFDARELFVLAIVCLICATPVQVVLLNNALKLHAATLVIPIYLSTMTISMAFVGGVVFDELSAMSTWRVSMFVTGLGLTIAGVFALSENDSSSFTSTNTVG